MENSKFMRIFFEIFYDFKILDYEIFFKIG